MAIVRLFLFLVNFVSLGFREFGRGGGEVSGLV